jgi:hypothetical protein
MTTQRPSLSARCTGSGDLAPRRHLRRGICLVTTALTLAGIAVAPPATASTTDLLREAVVAARGAACGPLRPDPVVDKAAEEINETTDEYINFAARAVPETDALSPLKDLGYGGSTAAILSSAAQTDANAIKALLLQGYAKIPDCSYRDLGVSTLYNAKRDLILATVVLAG